MSFNKDNVKLVSNGFVLYFMDLCSKSNIPFVEICLGFVYASKKVLKSMIELKMFQQKDIDEIDRVLTQIIDVDIEENRDLIDSLNRIAVGEKTK